MMTPLHTPLEPKELVTGIKLTAEFFNSQNPLLRVSPDTRMQLLFNLSTSLILPIVQSVEMHILTSSTTYKELKELGLFKCVDDAVTIGLSKVCVTKKGLEKLGIKLILEKEQSEFQSVVTLTPKEKKYRDNALYVLHSYNEAREQFYRKKGQTFIPAPMVYAGKTMKSCVRIAEWLEKHKIDDTRLYIFTVFRHFGWDVVPGWNTFATQETYDYYHNDKDTTRGELELELTLEKQLAEDRKAKSQGLKMSVYRDLFPSIEKTKASLLAQGLEATCMSQPNELLGYHPKSAVCATCKLYDKCLEGLSQAIKANTHGVMRILDVRSGKQDLLDVEETLMGMGVTFNIYGQS